ncbi:MAG: divergent polysaccharide deacetylase family protein [Pseudomonadota bacterium]
MSARRSAKPSALKSGLMHLALSTAAFSALTLSAGGAIHLAGNTEDAGPRYELAMFDTDQPDTPPALKSRLVDTELSTYRLASMQPLASQQPAAEPSLGVPEPGADVPPSVQVEQGDAPALTPSDQRQGVRINGRTVYPGEAYSDAADLGALQQSPLPGLHERTPAGRLPIISQDGLEIADAYARPYYGRSGQPSVSLVLGGLGINYTHTKSAIDELPPEVTLSFAPHARGLQTWIKRAREAGHEVLIELPLEPHTHGRVRPHANMLSTNLDADRNIANLEKILGLGHGYFGVINYQGDKFSADTEGARAMFDALKSRGVAFIDDGSLPPTSTLEAQAGEAGARYARADFVIDARMEADAMTAQLQALEASALKDGGALGTAIGYPLTIDIIKDWTATLDAKGIILAPASALQSVPAPKTATTVSADVSALSDTPPSLP